MNPLKSFKFEILSELSMFDILIYKIALNVVKLNA